MKRGFIISILMLWGFTLIAQNSIDKVLLLVEKNNTTLSAIRKSIDAEKVGNKVGLAPQNPEAEFNFLWGNPSATGNRTDFSIKQSFDFPTAYSYKMKMSDLKNEQAELEYKKHRYEILYETRVLCVKLTQLNALKIELNKRQANALQVANAYKARYSAGEIGILEYNKARLNLLNVTKELESNEIERNTLLLELSALNGGQSIDFTDSQFSVQIVPADFEQWYSQLEANNPILQWVKQEIVITSKEAKLNTALSFPKFFGGYMSESVVGQQYQGVSVGITIPLWENNNTVKYAKAKTLAMQGVESDARLLLYNTMKKTHASVVARESMLTDYRSKLAMFSNSELLEKAFNKGEISLTEYLYELSLYYESVNKLLEMEAELNLIFAELNRYQ